MEMNELEWQLASAILNVLHERAYAPPPGRDPAIRDPYFAAAVQAIMERIKADGWLLVPPSTRWRDDPNGNDPEPSTTTPAELEEDLRLCIRFALMHYPHKPPRTRDFTATERYHSAIAAAVVKQILRSNWQLAPTLRKIPPAKLHSTPPH
jgi:hypothetical protein